MAQYEQEGPCDTSSYNSHEIHRAGRALSDDVTHGDLMFLQTVFENYPLQAVPNVWEGDEGMMEHVADFPVPPCIALPEQLVSEAGDSVPRVGRNKRPRPETHDDHDSTPVVRCSNSPEICDDGHVIPVRRKRPKTICGEHDLGIDLILTKKRTMKPKFWVNLVRVYESVLSIKNAFQWKVITDFASEKEEDRENACWVLNRLHCHLKRIRSALENAELVYNENKFVDMFQQMSPSQRCKFRTKNELQGEFPDSIVNIVQKFMEVRNQMKEFVLQNWTQLPQHKVFQQLIQCIHKKKVVFSGKKIFGCANVLAVGGDGVERLVTSAGSVIPGWDVEQGGTGRSEHVGDTEATNGLHKEEEFWKSVVHLKTLAQKVSVTLSQISDVSIPRISTLSIKKGSTICRQMFLARKNIVTLNKSLGKLREEMKTNNYEDKKPFSTDDFVYQGIDRTPVKSLDMLQAMLNKLQQDYLRIQDENSYVLEKIGYGFKVGFQKCVIKNIVLVRICAHSKSKLRAPGFIRINKGQSKIPNTQNDPGQQKILIDQKPVVEETGDDGSDEDNSDVSKTVNSTSFFMSNLEPGALTVSAQSCVPGQDSQQIAGGDYDSQKPVVEETGDDGSDEDYSDISKTVNSMSFFMSNLEPGALTVNTPSCTPATEEFIEQEKQYWDRLQSLLLKINKVFHHVEDKDSKSYSKRSKLTDGMKNLHLRIRQLFKLYQSERDQGYQAGYCMHVTYLGQEQMADSYEDTLVKSLDQVKDRIDVLYRNYIKVAKKLGFPFSYNLI